MAIARRLTAKDHGDAMALYRVLAGNDSIQSDKACFDTLIAHPGTLIFGADSGGRIKSMATLHLLPNITQNGRPYGLIENVVTDPAARGQGLARLTMRAAIDDAWQADAYKIMLLSGRDTGALGFYEKLGFRADQKHGLQLRRVPPRAV